MKEDAGNVITSGAIAKELGVSDAKVKKAIKELNLQPKEKRGVCNYYAREAVGEIQKALAK